MTTTRDAATQTREYTVTYSVTVTAASPDEAILKARDTDMNVSYARFVTEAGTRRSHAITALPDGTTSHAACGCGAK